MFTKIVLHKICGKWSYCTKSANFTFFKPIHSTTGKIHPNHKMEFFITKKLHLDFDLTV